MNKKGQSVGTFIALFVTIIVGIVLFQVIAQQVGGSTNTVTVNSSETLAANGASIYIDEYKAISSVVIKNATGGETIAAGNYTVTNNVINPTTGALSVKVTTDDAEYATESVYVQGTGQPLTYISDSGGRAVAGLIVIMFALAIVVVSISPTMRGGLADMLKR